MRVGRASAFRLLSAEGMRFVDLEEARSAPGLRLVIAAGLPSPWSQGAMGILDLQGIDYLAIRFKRAADDIKAWTGWHNAPVAIHNDEPIRTGWAEILALAERLGGARALVPADDDQRVRLFGLGHELLGEGGLCWNVRLLLIHAGLTTNGAQGWPLALANWLGPKYGYAPDRVDAARARAVSVLRRFGRLADEAGARGHDYLLGAEPTALDVYAAVSLGVVAPLPHDQCPMLAPVRHAFETLEPAVRAAVPDSLVQHRDRMHQRHLPLPVRF